MNIGCFGVKMLPRASPSDAPCARRGRRQPTSTTSTASTPPPPRGPPSLLLERLPPRDFPLASRRHSTEWCTCSGARATAVWRRDGGSGRCGLLRDWKNDAGVGLGVDVGFCAKSRLISSGARIGPGYLMLLPPIQDIFFSWYESLANILVVSRPERPLPLQPLQNILDCPLPRWHISCISAKLWLHGDRRHAFSFRGLGPWWGLSLAL